MPKSKIIATTADAIRARALESLQKAGQPRVVAQTLFSAVARAAGLSASRNLVNDFTSVKPIVKEMCLRGNVEFHHVEGGTSYYTIPSIDSYTGNSAHPVGGASVEASKHFVEGTPHLQAARLIASREWTPNMKRLQEAADMIVQGKKFDGGQWVPCLESDEAYKTQRMQVAAVQALTKNGERRFAFDVKCDDRGRFYVRGGYASPYMGKFGRWLWTGDDEVTLDHRTSFAQNFALLTGSDWGKHCGVGSADEGDFWRGVLAPFGVDIKPHSVHRDACKLYGMPLFYGASKARAEESAIPRLKEAVSLGEITEEEAEKIRKALTAFGEKLASFGEKTRAYAQSFVDWGEFPEWETPSGFIARKSYYHHKTVVWNSGENDVCFYPKSMTVIVKTKRICEQPRPDSADKSVLVATCANILQSLDASVMALTVIKYHAATGRKLFPLHDSYTVKREDAEVLTECVCEAMREVADSPQIKALRRELGLMPVKVITGRAKPSKDCVNLDLRAMNPLDEE